METLLGLLPKHLHLDSQFMVLSAMPEHARIMANPLGGSGPTLNVHKNPMDPLPPSSMLWQYPPWLAALCGTGIHLVCHHT